MRRHDDSERKDTADARDGDSVPADNVPETDSRILRELGNLPPGAQKELQERFEDGDLPSLLEVSHFLKTHRGPLPDPETLAEYNNALPNAAERIVAEWEEESIHRRTLQSRGQWMAFGLGALALAAAVVCAIAGQPWVGGVIVLSAMLGIGATGALSLFLQRRR